MKMFKLRKPVDWTKEWHEGSEVFLQGIFHYWINNRHPRLSMDEYLLDTEIRTLLADLRRAIIDTDRKRENRLKEKIDICIFEFYRLKIGRKPKI